SAGVRGAKLLKLQLVGSLGDDTLPRFYSGDNGDLRAVFVTHNDITTFEFLAGDQDVNDLLAFVFQHSFARNKKDRARDTGIESKLRLHSNAQLLRGSGG